MSDRSREQLEGALQVTVAALVLAVAFVASHIQPWNLPEFRPMRTFVLFELAALALAYVVVTRARPRLLPAAPAVGAFTALAVLSTAWSARPDLTLERALGFAVLIVASVALAVGAVGRPRVAGQLMLALLAGAVLIALAGLVELWHDSNQAVLAATIGQGARYNGIGQNPNQVAMLIALTMPLALWAVRCATRRLRLAVWLAALLLVGSLVASGSRGSVIGAFVGSFVYLLAVVRERRLAAAVLVTVAFVTAMGVTQLPQPSEEEPILYERFGQTPKLSPRDLNAGLPLESEFGFPGENVETGRTRTLFFSSGRFEAWQVALEQGLRRLVAGYGFGTEDETFVDRSYLFVSQFVENSFISVFLQLGTVGFGVLVAALALAIVTWWRSRSRLDAETGENAAACAGVVVAGITVALSQSYLTAVGSPATASFWIAFALLGALTLGRSATRPPSRRAEVAVERAEAERAEVKA